MRAEWQGMLAKGKREIAGDRGDKKEGILTCPICFGRGAFIVE